MNTYLARLQNKPYFKRNELLELVQLDKPTISKSSFYRLMKRMLDDEDIIRVAFW